MNLSYEKCVSLSNCNYKLSENVLQIIKTITSELKEKELQLANRTKPRVYSSTIKKTWKPNDCDDMKIITKSLWRSKNPEKPATVSLYKQINLILNSVVETNANSITSRIQQLLLNHKKNDLNDVYVKMSTQLIVNAFAQSLYSEAYATIISRLTKNIGNDFDFRNLILEKCENDLSQIITGQNTRFHELKGCGSFYAHLYLINFLSKSEYETFLVNITKTIQDDDLSIQVRDICCTILISSLQNIKNVTSTLPPFILEFIKQNLENIWSDKAFPMRMRIKLLDVKDIS